MLPIRFSLKFLLLSFAVLAALLAVPAWFISQIRNELAAAKRINELGWKDQGYIAGEAAFHEMPREPIRRWLYKVAGSPGEVDDVRILGDESAKGIAALARSLPNVRIVRVAPSAASPDELSLITQSQIDAVSCFETIKSLEFDGRFAPGLDFQSWSRVKRIDRVEITGDSIPPPLMERLADANVDRLTIYCHYDWKFHIPPSSEAFSFEKIPCTNVIIVGNLDDRALELIFRAPRLDSLTVRCEPRLPPRVTDAGIRQALRNLHVRHLVLSTGVQLTEATAEALASIRELPSLNVTNLSPEARARLYALRPDLK